MAKRGHSEEEILRVLREAESGDRGNVLPTSLTDNDEIVKGRIRSLKHRVILALSSLIILHKPIFLDVLQLSRLLGGDVKESRNGNPTGDLQMATGRTRIDTLCGPVVSWLFSFAARC